MTRGFLHGEALVTLKSKQFFRCRNFDLIAERKDVIFQLRELAKAGKFTC